MNREDIHIISRHSNWSEQGIDRSLKDNIYSNSESWKKFLQYLFISLGIGFTVSGIIFFFAFNWADLNKFAKIGLIEGLLVLTTLAILIPKINPIIKDITLTGASVLVGVLFAVFGQIYQTGANAYDFFLAWTLGVTIWVVISNFPPLWIIYFLLINTTLILYSEQVAHHWTTILLFTLLFGLNSIFLFISLLIQKLKSEFKIPTWFINIIALAAVFFSTMGIINGIFTNEKSFLLALIIYSAVLYALGLIYGYNYKKVFYLAIIPFSIILIISSSIIRTSQNAGMFFLVSLLIIASITILTKILLNLQRKWSNE